MPSYPTVQFLVKHGGRFAAASGVVLALAGLWAAAVGCGWYWAPAGIVGGGIAWLGLASYVELVRIIADTLLPR